MKFYRGSAGAARSYVEADRSRADDCYLDEGTGLADLLHGEAVAGNAQVRVGGTLDGDAYEAWVGGYTADGAAKGRLRNDEDGLRFVEVVVNGPKSWSLAAAVHPEIAAAYDRAQDSAAHEIVTWLTANSTTRVGPRGRQVQVPVERLEAAVVRHHTSRAGDPHRHLHLQVNARVFAAGAWRGLHSVGVVDSIEAINGIGHAAVATHPGFRRALAEHGYTLHPDTAEIVELQPYVSTFSARAAQITRHTDTYETAWRAEHPGQEPGPGLRRAWDRRAWATTRPDKVIPVDGTQLTRRWLEELTDAGFTPPTPPTADDEHADPTTPVDRLSRIDPDAVADLVLTRLGSRRSAWNPADIRGEVEKILPTLGLILEPDDRRVLAESLTTAAVGACVPLLDRGDVPGHIRHLSSPHVLAVEADITDRLAARSDPGGPGGTGGPADQPGADALLWPLDAARALAAEFNRPGPPDLDHQQRAVAAALAGTHELLVVEGAAGAGKTTTLAAARLLLEHRDQRLMVVTPTLKAAQVAAQELGAAAHSAAWLVHQHGYRWDDDGRWTRQTKPRPHATARLLPGDLLLIDEAGMLDQDTAAALLTIADETHARIAFVGDRHQLPAVGRGGVLDLAARWVPPTGLMQLDTVHRFTDPAYADLSLQMRTGEHPGNVFDELLANGHIVIHPTAIERLHHVASLAGAAQRGGGQGGRPLITADTREQVRTLNATIRESRRAGTDTAEPQLAGFVTRAGEQISVGDRVTTRRNDRDLAVTNRDRWTITAIDHDRISVEGRVGSRTLPAAYALHHLELAYATTVHGAQGETVDTAHFLLDDTTGAASAYVAMTRGRHHNTAHLVADNETDARAQWITTFTRDRADLGPAHAAQVAAIDIDRFGAQPGRRAERPITRRVGPPGASPGR